MVVLGTRAKVKVEAGKLEVNSGLAARVALVLPGFMIGIYEEETRTE